MEISRYASRLDPTSSVLPSGRPFSSDEAKVIPLQTISATGIALTLDQFPRDLPQEPDDARLTGGTRSLSRRLLALNIPVLSSIRSGSVSSEISPKRPKIQRAVLAKPGLIA